MEQLTGGVTGNIVAAVSKLAHNVFSSTHGIECTTARVQQGFAGVRFNLT